MAGFPSYGPKILGVSSAFSQAATVELVPYLLASFGHPGRIDYGTGHETSFVVWLCEFNASPRLAFLGVPSPCLLVWRAILPMKCYFSVVTDCSLFPPRLHVYVRRLVSVYGISLSTIGQWNSFGSTSGEMESYNIVPYPRQVAALLYFTFFNGLCFNRLPVQAWRSDKGRFGTGSAADLSKVGKLLCTCPFVATRKCL